MKPQALLVFSSLLFLNGCATYLEQISQSDCLTTHWYEEGFDAAKVGRSKAPAWSALDQSCEKTNMWSDKSEFDKGYELGVSNFCTSINGFEFGQRNNDYDEICPADSQAIFNSAYADGLALYDSSYNIETATDNLSIAHSEISDGKERRRYLRKLIKSGSLDDKTKKKYVKERYSLKSQISSAKSSLSQYRADIARFTREQASLEYQLFEKYYASDNVENAQNEGYSVTKTAETKDLVLSEPAILLYKPELMDREQTSHYKKLAKEINSYVSTTVERSFRYQVVSNAELVFNLHDDTQLKTNPAYDYQQPTLLFWDGKKELSSLELPLELTKPPLVELARFIQLTARDKILIP